ncbi:MAG: hypothetical protein Kow0032_04850 [Methyloligellaceae bacterium]
MTPPKAPDQRRERKQANRRQGARGSTAASGKRAGGESGAGREPLRVLIVDENREDVARIRRHLSRLRTYKASTRLAAPGANLREALSQAQSDVALIDFDMDAAAAQAVMRGLEAHAGGIAIVALVAGGRRRGGRQRAREAGIHHLVSKADLSSATLEDAIRASLNESRLEAQLSETQVELERATRARADFFAQIGHDLKAPLNSVLGYSEAIAHEVFGPVDNPRYKEYARAVHEAGTHLLTLIDNLIQFSAGKDQRRPMGPHDLNELVEFAIRMTDLARQKRGHRLVTTLSPTPVTVRCQGSAISQAIINLLTNAIKYTPEKGLIEVTVGKTSRHAEVTVRDNGIGMSQEDISIALRPFGRVPLPPESAQEGTGLGLHIIREIMARHKGQLELTSAPGNGTTAILRLPLSRSRGKSA